MTLKSWHRIVAEIFSLRKDGKLREIEGLVQAQNKQLRRYTIVSIVTINGVHVQLWRGSEIVRSINIWQ